MDPFTANIWQINRSNLQTECCGPVLDGMFGQRNYDDPLQDALPSSSRVGILKVGPVSSERVQMAENEVASELYETKI